MEGKTVRHKLLSENRKDECGNMVIHIECSWLTMATSSSPIEGWDLFPSPWTYVGHSDLEPTECAEMVLCDFRG